MSHFSTHRSLLNAATICGGPNEHCCTQEASMPVSSTPCRTVMMNNPDGTRPRAANASGDSSWLIDSRSFQNPFDNFDIVQFIGGASELVGGAGGRIRG